ncbi:hypothetical protein PVAND_000031 [Polypedilum vanderplanki]|uniref:DUF4776 domain-containing protein n=1 Tax=Polypedilum vanderplanki TaxID=319348 RepID=A0A9J6BIL1_POLVA|nr:hypothetical protein PVAND_000031 [Polypedilum vanderplanki]
MSSQINSQDCLQTNVNETTEYHLKFIIQKLNFLNQDNNENGLKNITLSFDFDSKVIHIENIQDKIFPIGHEISLPMSAKIFSEKLKDIHLMINLNQSDSSADLGFLKISLNNFGDKVLCDDFESEKIIVEEKFVHENIETAEIGIVIEINCSNFINPLKNILTKNKAEKRQQFEEIPVSISSVESICDNNTTEKEESSQLESSHLYPSSSNKPSSKSKSGKCLSDIATSLELDSFSDKETIYCNECCGFSISGVTCQNKIVLESISKSESNSTSEFKTNSKEVSSNTRPKVTKLCLKKCSTVRRICSECFEDLSQLPENAPCHKCAREEKKVSSTEALRKFITAKENKNFMSTIDPKFVESQVELAVKRIFGLHIDEPEIEKNMEEKIEKKMKKKKKSVKVCEKKKRPITAKSNITRPKTPRCAKVNQIKKESKTYKGLRIRHPGVIAGHKECQQLPPPVPKNMGWLWNIPNPGFEEKYRAGWKPGAIKKSVSKLMDHFLKPKPAAEPNILEDKQKSTLKVQKKNGEYTFVMNPKNKQDHSSGDHCPPIVFKVTKKSEEKRRADALKEMKTFGIDKMCRCESIDECCHMNLCEKLLLKRELKKVSERYCICPELSWEELNDENESEINFEFTPPFDMKNEQKIIKVSNEETQYEPQIIEKCPSSVYEEEPIMEGRFQMLNKLRAERLQKIKEAKEAKALKEALAAKAREEAEKKKKAASNAKKGKAKAPLVMLDCPQECIAYQAKCFDPCAEIRCGPKVYRACNSICQPCPLPKCTISPTCSRMSKFYQQRCCQ